MEPSSMTAETIEPTRYVLRNTVFLLSEKKLESAPTRSSEPCDNPEQLVAQTRRGERGSSQLPREKAADFGKHEVCATCCYRLPCRLPLQESHEFKQVF